MSRSAVVRTPPASGGGMRPNGSLRRGCERAVRAEQVRCDECEEARSRQAAVLEALKKKPER